MYLILRKGIYTIKYRSEDGEYKTKSTGTRIKKDANKFLNIFKPFDEHGREVSLKKISLQKFKEEYIQFIVARYSKSYREQVNLLFKNMGACFPPNTPLVKLNTKRIEDFLGTIDKPHVALHTYKALSAAMSRAKKWNYIKHNPMIDVEKPNPPVNIPAYISEDELSSICENEINISFSDIYKTSFYTGMRRGEIIKLRWCDINFKYMHINVKAENSKNNKERIIPIPSPIKYIFTESVDNYSLVFPKIADQMWSGNYISNSFKKAARAANMHEDVHFHSLRHSYACHLAQRGISLMVIKELMGHKDFKTTLQYARLQTVNLEEAVEVFNHG